MRELTSHKVSGLNEALKIQVLDEPGQGGACHRYRITDAPATVAGDEPTQGRVNCSIDFQNGPIGSFGVNGVSSEALLAIVEDRLASFQAGSFCCAENEMALVRVRESLMWLQKRTRDRTARGVEGTSQQ